MAPGRNSNLQAKAGRHLAFLCVLCASVVKILSPKSPTTLNHFHTALCSLCALCVSVVNPLSVPGRAVQTAKMRARALSYAAFGPPAEVLRLVEVELPPPGPGQALVRLRAAVIHPSDFGRIDGRYGTKAKLPAVGGREGVAEVIALGPDTAGLTVGTRVLLPKDTGAWQDHQLHPVTVLVPVPDGVADDQAAQARINPGTAWNLLHRFAATGPVVQNAAGSAVGRHVAQLCRHLGRPCFGFVRRAAERTEGLLADGHTAVFEDDGDAREVLRPHLGKNPATLALNAVGGPSLLRLLAGLGDGGQVITYGGADFSPLRWPTRQLIFQDHAFRGYWHDQWERSHPVESNALLARTLALQAAGELSAPVAATYPLDQWAEALAHQSAARDGKILLTA